MKNDNSEITIIILASSIVLLLIMITITVINIEQKIMQESIVQISEDKINDENNYSISGIYYNNSDIENKTIIKFNNDGSFIFHYNTCTSTKQLTGIYQINNNYIYLTILDNTDLEKEILMVNLDNGILEYRGNSIGCSPFEYSIFIKK